MRFDCNFRNFIWSFLENGTKKYKACWVRSLKSLKEKEEERKKKKRKRRKKKRKRRKRKVKNKKQPLSQHNQRNRNQANKQKATFFFFLLLLCLLVLTRLLGCFLLLSVVNCCYVTFPPFTYSLFCFALLSSNLILTIEFSSFFFFFFLFLFFFFFYFIHFFWDMLFLWQ